jgi:gem associated protein 2
MENSNEEMEAATLGSLRKEETKGDDKGLQRKYTRSEMEALRFAQLEYQLELFNRVYSGLDPKIRREFDGISVVDSKKKKNSRNMNKNNQRSRNTGRGGSHQEMLIPGMIYSYFVYIFFFFSIDYSGNKFVISEEQFVAGPSNQFGLGEICNKFENMECEEDDDVSDDSYDGILKPAFVVEGEPDFESGPPVDGWEYLRRVRF